MEFVIKGSSVRTWKTGDPNIFNLELLLKEANDLDVAIRISQKDYYNFVDEFKLVLDDLYFDNKITLVEKDGMIAKIYLYHGKLQYSEILNISRLALPTFINSLSM